MIIALNVSTRAGFGSQLAAGILAYAHTDRRVELHLPYAPICAAPLGSTQCDGIIGTTKEWGQKALDAGIPAVNVYVRPQYGFPQVTYDHKSLIDKAMLHLMQTGVSHFAYVTIGDPYLKGLRQRLIEKHPLIRRDNFRVLIQEGYSDDSPCTILDQLQDLHRPTGIFVDADAQGAYLLRVCQENGIVVPGDVSVISVNNYAHICARTEPTLTSLDVGWERIGFEAARLLTRMIDGAPSPKEPVIVEGISVVPRESTNHFTAHGNKMSFALSYMEQHLDQPLTLDDIASELHMSKRTFERQFCVTMNTPPIKYLNEIRYEKAKSLLSTTSMTLQAIAKACGYDNASYLCQVFRKRLGVTPTSYRNSPNESPKQK